MAPRPKQSTGPFVLRAMGVGSGPSGGFVLQPAYGGAKKQLKKSAGKAGKSAKKEINA